ncbi:MAG: bifunctional (p)ppGpp synthetase/guanosine-3',5'-bis(diphosphate) 3'-pyrophosphohydrolase [Firmicutes bacterium]|jgi:(p)ppGpp synthase/HD superfamily hydrolase|nr:bifunctional (p)ppGpp synthetase/guanosine-3',5'-bis(diphosphate) 3'-pyrophosphohydrolase [Bacillota bacterium]
MTRNPPGDGVWLVEKAIEMAVQAHANQKRKGTDQPYIVHPLSVGMLLMKHGYPEHLVIAGLLHDTLEDTDLTEEEIRRVFGDPVAELVRGCSEPDKSLPWEERKKHTLSYLQTAPYEVCIVTCADKLQNVRAMAADYAKEGADLWRRFNAPKEKQYWYYTELAKVLGARLKKETIAELLRQEVVRLFKDLECDGVSP